MLGADTLGHLILGTFPESAPPPAAFPQWSTNTLKAGLSAAVLATTLGGFVAPPQARAAPLFSTFAQPVQARTVQQRSWLSTPFVPPSTVFTGFSDFGALRAKPTWLFEDQSWNIFEPKPPLAVPFTGFFDFGRPQQTRFNVAAESASVLFEVTPQQIAQAGGTSRKLPVEPAPRRKAKTGFEPVKKVHAPPEAIQPAPIPLPPFKVARAPDALPAAPAIVDPNLIPKDMLGLRDQIFTAQDISDVEAFLRGHDHDEQDVADILDALASLDEQDET